jgi:hypothetical protein
VTESVLLSAVKQINQRINVDGRVEEWNERAAQVSRYRDYFDGDHKVPLSPEMRKRLRLPLSTDQFTANYIPLIIKTMSGRLLMSGITGDTAQGTEWLEDVLSWNDFDLLQVAVNDANLLDGETFVMVGWDNVGMRPLITHELAYDGFSGIIPIYYNDSSRVMACAIKIWTEFIRGEKSGRQILDAHTRVNIYYEDRIEKYRSAPSGPQIVPYIPEGETSHIFPWVDRLGRPLGIPIIHFANRRRNNYGKSEVADAIPLQDVLNRVLYTLVATAEAMGFPNRVAIGFDPSTTEDGEDADIGPGDWLIAAPDGLMPGQQVDIKDLESGNLAPLIDLARHIVREIGTVTSTPAPEIFLSDSISGEAFKTREASLVTKARSYQLEAGASWELVADLAWRIQDAFGSPPPDYVRFRARWKEVDIRSNKDVVSQAVQAVQTGNFSRRAFLRAVAPVFELDDQDIEKIIKELKEDAAEGIGLQQMGQPDPMNGSRVNLKSTDDAVEKMSEAKEPAE